MPLSQQILMMLTLMVTSKGVAAVPRASLVILSGRSPPVSGLPLSGVALILGVDAVMDMGAHVDQLVGTVSRRR
jgi:proton glutamate symport protein